MQVGLSIWTASGSSFEYMYFQVETQLGAGLYACALQQVDIAVSLLNFVIATPNRSNSVKETKNAAVANF